MKLRAKIIANRDETFPRWAVVCAGRPTEWFGSFEQARDQAEALNVKVSDGKQSMTVNIKTS